MPTGDKNKQIRAANEFRIWRLAESVNWDCSITEIAHEVGLTSAGVSKICQDKGWTKRLTKGTGGLRKSRQDVDVLISERGGFWAGLE